ncbi:MAG: coenzyme F420-0:L-glutamate ligase [Patescibacteria group bacterium]
MQVRPIKTSRFSVHQPIEPFLDQFVPQLAEKSIVAVTSKIVALSEGAVIERETGSKDEKYAIVRQIAERYTEPSQSQYQLILTVKHNILAVNAGLDESNADGQYVLLPTNPYHSAERIWRHLRERDQLEELGVIITDSRTFPLKWGTIGTALSHCGFVAVNDRRGEKDLYGHEMQMTKENLAEGLAVAANVVMGEVAEAQPVAVLTEVPGVQFQTQPPTSAELEELGIELEEDAYAPILTRAPWHKGGGGEA